MKLFGSSGIRGIANKEITPELALKVGLAVGTLHKSAVIGRDPRTSGEMIEYALISGMLSAGCDVSRLGMVSTPTVAYASRNYDFGIMVTASHNPSQYGGIKLWNKDGMAFDSQQQELVESIISNKSWKYATWDNIGKVSEVSGIDEHIKKILDNVGKSSLKVVIDCGCGAASNITPYVLRKMGCKVITLNSQPDGFFPARNPEPTDENLELLKKAVVSYKADLGIAHDGDADRMMAVDGKGRFVDGDKMLALFGVRECEKSIAVPIDTSLLVDDILSGKIVYKTRVGDVYVAEELKKRNSEFGGEPSGSWIFPKISLCPDGIYAAARLVEIVEKDGKLDKIIDDFPDYPVKRGALECSNEKKGMVMEKIKNRLEILGNVNTIDGVRVDTKEGWILIRPSGTEPKIRFTAQAREGVDELYNKAEKILKEVL